MNKYGNKKTIINGIVFDSKKESERYYELLLLQKAAVKYIADFVYIENGKMIVEDVKGVRTQANIIKRKLFKHKYCSDYVIFREV